jgi:hypothetical protein
MWENGITLVCIISLIQLLELQVQKTSAEFGCCNWRAGYDKISLLKSEKYECDMYPFPL